MKTTPEMASAFEVTHQRVMAAGGTESYDPHLTESGQFNTVRLTASDHPPTITMRETYAPGIGHAVTHHNVTTAVLDNGEITITSQGSNMSQPALLSGEGLTDGLSTITNQPPGFRLAQA